jgi:hypothetical protein
MNKRTDWIVIASAKAKSGKEKELEQALRDVAKPTRAQAGWSDSHCGILLRFGATDHRNSPCLRCDNALRDYGALILSFDTRTTKEPYGRYSPVSPN